MKTLILEAYNHLVYKEVEDPVIQDDEVLVQIKSSGICGSDVHGMDGSTGRRIPPIIMGHEASGVIVEVGSEVETWKAGDRVTFDSTIYKLDDWYTRKGMYNLSDNRMVLGVSPGEYRRQGTFAELAAIPQHILYRIPEKVTFDQAAMVEPAAVALHAVELTPVAVADTAVVVGAGMVGLFVIQALKAKGCREVIAVDIDADRLALAKKLGAAHGCLPEELQAGDVIKEMTDGRGADIGFEVVGLTQTIQTAIQTLRRGATLTLVGNLNPTIELPLQAVVTQQLRLQGSCAICGEYPAVLNMIENGSMNVDAILSAMAPLSEGAAWFKRLYDKEKGLLKVILKP